MTGERVYREIELSKLLPNPWNPRKSFEGQKFNDLVESIRAKGVLEPILVRPVTDLATKKKDKDRKEFQIVAGERRWRASCEIAQANGGMKKATIPAIVQEMTDDDAFDVMTIENLHRDDLTEMEEAESFRAWVERRRKKDKKADAVKDLADRTGIGQRYIRRRIKIMELPEKILKAWDKGQIAFGHCEQLLRLGGDEKKIDEYFSKVKNWDGYSVGRMRHDINEESVELQHAAFDTVKAGCNECQSNTDVQKQLFGDEMALSKTSCLNTKCFKKNQNEGLLANWEKKYRKRYVTNGFRFYEGYNQPKFQSFGKYNYGCKHKEPAEKCADCKDLVTILEVGGKVYCKQACLNEKCYTLLKTKKDTVINKEQIGSSTSPSTGQGEDEPAPRVSWHGQHFREEFFQDSLPGLISTLDVDGDQCLRIVLAGILNSNFTALEYFRKMALTSAVPYRSGRYSFEPADWKFIEGMDCVALRTALKALGGYIAMQADKTSHETRCAIASHLGIDLARDWRITQSYLDKKTKAEILSFGEQLGLFADSKAEAFLHDVLGKRKFSALKKAEIDRVILESGVDLAGKVPAEILDVKDGSRADDDDEDGCMDYISCPHFDECEHISQKCKRQWDEEETPPCCHECDYLEVCEDLCQLYECDTQNAGCEEFSE